MNDNVHVLPVCRKGGRRRVRPVRNAPLAEVLSIAPSPKPGISAERLVVIVDHIDALATAVLNTVSAARAEVVNLREQMIERHSSEADND